MFKCAVVVQVCECASSQVLKYASVRVYKCSTMLNCGVEELRDRFSLPASNYSSILVCEQSRVAEVGVLAETTKNPSNASAERAFANFRDKKHRILQLRIFAT